MTAAQTIRFWREDPVRFVEDNFGVTPDAWQSKALRAFASKDADKMRIALSACAGPGKSAVLAWIGWNFLACYGEVGEHPKGAVVSITSDNLADNIWPELSKWQSRSPFLSKTFTWTKTRIFANDHPETWFLSARSWPKTANADEQGRVLSGLHSKFVLYLIDESGDIPPAVLKAAEQGLSNCVFGKIVQAGNPTSHDGMLYEAVVLQADKWFVVNITGDPDDPMRSPRIDIEWAREQIDTHGRDNPWVQAYILGQFPSSGLNTLLSPEEVEEAMGRKPKREDYEFAQKRLGVDVARFGDDSTILFPRQGLLAYQPTQLRGARTNEIAAKMAMVKKDFEQEMELVDDTGGYGAGVIDMALLAGHSPVPVNFSGNATDPRYFNLRSEMWFEMADWIKRGGALPNIPILKRELVAPTYTFQNGKFRLEEKDQIKKRLGFSPDHADALALTFAIPEMPATHYIPGVEAPTHMGGGQSVKHEYNPFDDTRT